MGERITLFLCGDVMLGRGIDQILPHPGDPRLHERYVASAKEYVALAEWVNGPIPAPVDFSCRGGCSRRSIAKARSLAYAFH